MHRSRLSNRIDKTMPFLCVNRIKKKSAFYL